MTDELGDYAWKELLSAHHGRVRVNSRATAGPGDRCTRGGGQLGRRHFRRIFDRGRW
jgi:hypothetical protein